MNIVVVRIGYVGIVTAYV